MNAQFCLCCGEPLTPKGQSFSRTAGTCPSCSSLLDGMDETPARLPDETVDSSSLFAGHAVPERKAA